MPNSFAAKEIDFPSFTVLMALSRSSLSLNKLDEVSHLITLKQPDVCVFTESWLDDDPYNRTLVNLKRLLKETWQDSWKNPHIL